VLSVAGLEMEGLMEQGHCEPGHCEPGHCERDHCEPGHCALGSRLYDQYFDKSVDWAIAEASTRTDGSKLDYEKARCGYIEHVVGCTECAWDVLVFSYLDAMDHSCAARAEAIYAER
jgi:hypothetical protein